MISKRHMNRRKNGRSRLQDVLVFNSPRSVVPLQPWQSLSESLKSLWAEYLMTTGSKTTVKLNLPSLLFHAPAAYCRCHTLSWSGSPVSGRNEDNSDKDSAPQDLLKQEGSGISKRWKKKEADLYSSQRVEKSIKMALTQSGPVLTPL